MLKNIQIKIVLAFSIIGAIVIVLLSTNYISDLKNINNQIDSKMELQEVQNIINFQIYEAKIMMCIYLAIFIILMIIMGIIVAKVIISPISNLVKSAEKATKGNKAKYLLVGNSKKNEINELVSAFDTMNNELKENLNEATRQQKQIETILLNMTDGIIAFNMDGKIIHINPAAKTFLNIKDEKNFEEIFGKYDVDINLEKIIYLENWTSSEKN